MVLQDDKPELFVCGSESLQVMRKKIRERSLRVGGSRERALRVSLNGDVKRADRKRKSTK